MHEFSCHLYNTINDKSKYTLLNTITLFQYIFFSLGFYTPVYISLLTVCTGTVDDDDVVLLSE